MNRRLPPVVKNIIIINIIFYLATLMLPRILNRWGINFDLTNMLGLHYFTSGKFNAAQLVTYMFLHAPFPNLSHIFFNMFAVFMFGPILEYFWGSKKFLLYYLITGIGAGLVQQLFWYFDMGNLFSALNTAVSNGSGEALIPFTVKLSHYFKFNGDITQLPLSDLLAIKNELQNSLLTVGASGAIFGLLLAFGWLFPEERMFLIFLPIPIKARWFITFYAVAELFLGVANFSGDNVAHFAHLGGMLFGLILLLYWRKNGKLYR